MTLTEARAKLAATISRLEDSARRDPIRSHPVFRRSVASVIQDGSDLWNIYGEATSEVEAVEDLKTITSHLNRYADHLAEQIAQHRTSDASPAPVSGTTLTEAEFAALLDGMTREEFDKFLRLGRAGCIVVEASNPQSKKELAQVVLAVKMANRNDPHASAATLAADALLILGVTP